MRPHRGLFSLIIQNFKKLIEKSDLIWYNKLTKNTGDNVMPYQVDIDEFPRPVREFASYKTAIQGCSQKTVDEYLLDLRTFFRYLIAKKNGINPDSDEFDEE